MAQFPWSPELGVPEMSLCETSSCSWILSSLANHDWVKQPQAGWLWGSTSTKVYEVLYRCWPHEVEFTSSWSVAYQDIPLYVPHVELIGSLSDVVWSSALCVFIVRYHGRETLVKDNVRHCLYWPWTICLDQQCNPEFEASTYGLSVYVGKAKLCTNASFYWLWARG